MPAKHAFEWGPKSVWRWQSLQRTLRENNGGGQRRSHGVRGHFRSWGRPHSVLSRMCNQCGRTSHTVKCLCALVYTVDQRTCKAKVPTEFIYKTNNLKDLRFIKHNKYYIISTSSRSSKYNLKMFHSNKTANSANQII